MNYLKNKKVVCDWTTRNVLKLKKKMRNKPKQSRLYDVPWNFPNQPRLNEQVINSGRCIYIPYALFVFTRLRGIASKT